MAKLCLNNWPLGCPIKIDIITIFIYLLIFLHYWAKQLCCVCWQTHISVCLFLWKCFEFIFKPCIYLQDIQERDQETLKGDEVKLVWKCDSLSNKTCSWFCLFIFLGGFKFLFKIHFMSTRFLLKPFKLNKVRVMDSALNWLESAVVHRLHISLTSFNNIIWNCDAVAQISFFVHRNSGWTKTTELNIHHTLT